MSYTPGIPLATDDPSVSQGQIKTNFEQLNTIFDIDHVAYDNATAADRGEHNRITLVNVIADPNQTTPKSSIYLKTIAASSELFFQNDALAADVRQISGIVPSTSATGLGQLNAVKDISGVIHTWGRLIIPPGTSTTANLTWPIAYSNVAITLTPETITTEIVASFDVIGTDFQIRRSGNNNLTVDVVAVGI